MGLYDGASPDGEEGSAAEIAKWLAAPVVAVVDAGGMARTIAAVGVGLRAFDPALDARRRSSPTASARAATSSS